MANATYFHQLFLKSIILSIVLAGSLELSFGQGDGASVAVSTGSSKLPLGLGDGASVAVSTGSSVLPLGPGGSTNVDVSAGPLDLSVGVGGSTRVGFYSTSCPEAESIVQSVVRPYITDNRKTAPALLKLLYTDCFGGGGCDGSILLDGPDTEKTAAPNLNLRGYEVIDAAKKWLEQLCPGVVSCADILALAARDAVVETGGASWDVPTGRRDGRISSASDASNMPSPREFMRDLVKKFEVKGLNPKDLVTLVGGHTIGTAPCSSFQYRLQPDYQSGMSGAFADISISRDGFLTLLVQTCPLDGSRNATRMELDYRSENQFDDSFFRNVRQGRGVLESDQRLWSHGEPTSLILDQYLGNRQPRLTFRDEFGKSMVKMSNIGVLTGSQGEIRKVCSAVNTAS